MQIGSIQLASPVIAAPMAGVSDRPYRSLARAMGAGLAVSEMLTSKPDLRHTTKSRFRMDIRDEIAPVAVQLVGTEPALLADAARLNRDNGAQIIDINMGCPAKKVCKKMAGSALLGDHALVADILQAVVAAVDIPVTLKIRTGLNPQQRNAPEIARIAEDSGIQALTVHGRTRQCKFVGAVEYDTIAAVKAAVDIAVIANGDIDSPQRAAEVMRHTGADAVMIGRAAQGQPWLFAQMVTYLQSGEVLPEPQWEEKRGIIVDHIQAIHAFYGARMGIKFARKHIAWYLDRLPGDLRTQRVAINQQQDCGGQLQSLRALLDSLDSTMPSNDCLQVA